jgi:hypothetical protein
VSRAVPRMIAAFAFLNDCLMETMQSHDLISIELAQWFLEQLRSGCTAGYRWHFGNLVRKLGRGVGV